MHVKWSNEHGGALATYRSVNRKGTRAPNRASTTRRQLSASEVAAVRRMANLAEAYGRVKHMRAQLPALQNKASRARTPAAKTKAQHDLTVHKRMLQVAVGLTEQLARRHLATLR